MKIPALADLGLVELGNASPLRVQLLPTGALFALRHGHTLLNQLLPDPAEDGLFRLLLRVHDKAGGINTATSLTGPGLAFSASATAAGWSASIGTDLQATTVLQLHPEHSAWLWRVQVRNQGTLPHRIDVLHAQDLGLADEGAVRNNEAYTSQYIDLLPLRDEALGWTIFARQNQPANGGRYPWIAFGCVTGAAACCTDGWQFFGPDHRLTGQPLAARQPALPSQRLQYEFALGGLQSRIQEVSPGATAEFVFVARYLPDHPAASTAADLACLRELLPAQWGEPALPPAAPKLPLSLFVSAPWLHGEHPSSSELAQWFPGKHRHLEQGPDGVLQSFFSGPDTHVVLRDKEARVARPHGHILRSGDSTWIDDNQFGITCYAAGIFGAQTYLGNPSFGRLLPVVRNALNLTRTSGQRVFVRQTGAGWAQLGIPSVFSMTPSDARWIYRSGSCLIEARICCSATLPATFFALRVIEGPDCEFLVTHQLVLGTMEFEQAGTVTIHAEDRWAACAPSTLSLVGQHRPGTAFAIASAGTAGLVRLGGSELIFPDSVARTGTQLVIQTGPVRHCGIIMLGSGDGVPSLPAAVKLARAEFALGTAPARPLAPRLRLSGGAAVETARIDEIIPWLNHNASIHYSAPHGLEQYGGAAWGVRDVCQGSVEWLLATGRHDLIRRVLTAVFYQQYAHDGSWPQWFMHDPYRFIQQAHSHGDVCFWPVKALCDYVEASNDFAFLDQLVGFTDHEQFRAVGPQATLWDHCDRVVAHCESRFMTGTALVNYGDGDWDDTLQPADPTMRTRMTSAWTVGLAFHTFRQLADLSRRCGQSERAGRLEAMLSKMRADFVARLMPEGIVAGFLLAEKDGTARPLLHPTDKVTGIRYRLLPMTRSILAELFTPAEAQRHLAIIEQELRFPDGVRLMSEPAVYHGGLEKLFKRADTAANVGREIGLQYVHAHLRYAEALAKVGDADRLWTALQVVNPVALVEVVPNAAARQSNVYFSSSDADFPDRYEAARRWSDLRRGEVAVRGGWRLYSSGPGLFLHKIRSCLLGLRESFADVIFDPVLPRRLDGLIADVTLCGRPVTLSFRIQQSTHSPVFITVNGRRLEGVRESNPYRLGGLRVNSEALLALLAPGPNRIEIEL